MTQLENRSEVVDDLNNQVENGLNEIDANSHLNATEALLFKDDNERKLKSMNESKDVVDGVLGKVKELYDLEKTLREPSPYRKELNDFGGKLDRYSHEMKDKIRIFSDTIVAGNVDRRKLNDTVQNFAKYGEEAKEIDSLLGSMEKEIKALKRVQDLEDRINKAEREQESQRDSQGRRIEELNRELEDANARARMVEDQQQRRIDELNRELEDANARARKAEEDVRRQRNALNRERQQRQQNDINDPISQSQG